MFSINQNCINKLKYRKEVVNRIWPKFENIDIYEAIADSFSK